MPGVFKRINQSFFDGATLVFNVDSVYLNTFCNLTTPNPVHKKVYYNIKSYHWY
ncbi:hypothetical protein C0J52_25216 [Blattella germanica]|nr:hypothetical protein C0J52_25216 [Blattella germanica]